MQKRNRRIFLQLVVLGIASIFLYLWNRLITQHLKLKSNVKKTVPFNNQKELVFQDEFIITNSNNTIVVFSSQCTHLGCKINKLENGRLICPCHGSEYNTNGEVLKGPAYKKLKKHHFTISDDGKNITINGLA